MNLGSDKHDAISIIKLRGKYRLDNDKLYFTILSRTVVEGKLEIGDPGVTLSLFQFDAGSKYREIKDPNPIELDTCTITLIKHSKIKINNEIYYKVK